MMTALLAIVVLLALATLVAKRATDKHNASLPPSARRDTTYHGHQEDLR